MSYTFNYISKHSPEIQKFYNELLEITLEVQKLLRKEISFEYSVVGSYSRNMITYNRKTNVGYDLDFNFDIRKGYDAFTAKQIRTKVQNALNQVAPKYGYSHAADNTRVLTIKVKDQNTSRVLRSCDFAIVNTYLDEDGFRHQEYVRFDRKTGHCSWCEQSDGFYMLPKKIEWLKSHERLWNELRDYYLYKKSTNPNPKELHSRDLFGQAVHETCQRNGYYDELMQ